MKPVEKSEQAEPVVHNKLLSHRTLAMLVALFLVLWLIPTTNRANAYLTTRSVTLGSALPSATTTNEFTFDALGAPAIGSLVFEYCSNTPLVTIACVPPVGFDSSAATLGFQSGDTGYSVHPNTALSQNRIVLTRTPSLSGAGTKQYILGNITNPSGSRTTTYVRIFTHPSDDGSGSYDDTGSVAFATQDALSVNVYVPPYLAMCVGVTVAIDCTSANGFVVDMGELSKTAPNAATTQFAVATNSFNGYNALLVGSTMTAGNRTIPALTTASGSIPGTSQFGVNLRANSNPGVGSNVEGLGTGSPAPGYGTPNTFRFVSGDTIASSSLSTEWNRYTISYLVNVSNSQPAGRYASTLTVIGTTTF